MRLEAGWRAALMSALALLVGACAHATDLAPSDAPALFVARDADSTIYLFGTVHLLAPGEPWGGADAQAALAASDEVWTEIDISPEADAAMGPLVFELGLAPASKPLSATLNADEKARLEAVLARLGMGPRTLEIMQPWFAAVTLSITPMVQAGFDPEAGVDRAVDSAADAEGKHRRAFETAEQQLRFFASLSPEAQHEMLIDAIQDAEAGPAMLNELTEAWAHGDLAAIEAIGVSDMAKEFPELYEVLFRSRNAAWAETLAHEMEGSGVDFVAVGVGHLVGEESLVAMLRARGIAVERVRAAH